MVVVVAAVEKHPVVVVVSLLGVGPRCRPFLPLNRCVESLVVVVVAAAHPLQPLIVAQLSVFAPLRLLLFVESLMGVVVTPQLLHSLHEAEASSSAAAV